jgi:hypothetical protein
MIRLLVCGGRDYVNERRVFEVLYPYKDEVCVLIHGCAAGADFMARQWALINNVPELAFKANWDRFGKAAGPKRNIQMLNDGKPSLVIAFPGGNGTAHMVRIAREAGVEVIEIQDV